MALNGSKKKICARIICSQIRLQIIVGKARAKNEETADDDAILLIIAVADVGGSFSPTPKLFL